jgi:hypothetical protein
VGHVACMGENSDAYETLVIIREGRGHLEHRVWMGNRVQTGFIWLRIGTGGVFL